MNTNLFVSVRIFFVFVASTILLIAFAAFAGDASGDVGLITTIIPLLPPKVGNVITVGLALVPIVQAIARGFAQAGKAINGKTDGAGSGWFKFWNRVAQFPGPKYHDE